MSRPPGCPPPTPRRFLLAAVLASLVAPAAGATPRRPPGHTRPKSAPAPKPPAMAPARVAVLAFDGDGATPVRRRVVRALRARGFKVVTSLRPVDSAEQYREMAATLGLCAYLDGEVRGEDDPRSAIIRLRSGSTGQRMFSATFSSDGRKLPGEVGNNLWRVVGPALVRARVDAAKPRKPDHAPMRINAGTPIESTPPAPTQADPAAL